MNNASATKDFPVFITTDDEKKVLRELEIHLILNPNVNPFDYLTTQRKSHLKGTSNLQDCIKYLALSKISNNLLQAFRSPVQYYIFISNSIIARMYITELLNFKIEWVTYEWNL